MKIYNCQISNFTSLNTSSGRPPTSTPCSLLAPVQPGDRPLCVLNTHLFFHYMAPHIRTMHVWAMVQASGVA